MTAPSPWDYPDRESYLAAMIQESQRLYQEAMAMPEPPPAPTFPWE